MTVILGALAVVAAVVALLARRLEHTGVLVGLAGGLLAVELLGRGEVAMATALIAGAGIMAAVMLVAVAVIEVDARPGRRLQPWKLLLLVPLGGIAGLASTEQMVAVTTASPRAVTGAVLVIAFAALGIPLLVRRASAPSPPSLPGGAR